MSSSFKMEMQMRGIRREDSAGGNLIITFFFRFDAKPGAFQSDPFENCHGLLKKLIVFLKLWIALTSYMFGTFVTPARRTTNKRAWKV